jgi:hypothetical protein
LDEKINSFYRMMKKNTKKKCVQNHLTGIGRQNISFSELINKNKSYMKKFSLKIIMLFLFWGTMSFSQNTYIDPTVTAAMILYSENLKAKQNEVIEETSKLKDAQTWVGTQMVAANDIQNKILKGLKEVSGTLQNGIQVKEIYSELNKCYTILHKWYN